MALTARASEKAATLGARAADTFLATGVPVPCPFKRDATPGLAAAWARAYVAGLATRRV